MICFISKGETVGSLDTSLTAFFQWLLKATLQGSLLVCLILLVKAVLRERLLARWHYCFWLVLLVRLILPWAPQSRLSIYNLIPQSLPSHRALSTAAQSAHVDATSAPRHAP
jgi:beta-lactamase regulating signal transducer with metallopeptidase domain